MPSLSKYISRASIKRFFSSNEHCINEQKQEIIEMFLEESSRIDFTAREFIFCRNLRDDTIKYKVIEDEIETFIELSDQLPFEFRWKLFISVSNYEKDKMNFKEKSHIEYLIDLLEQRKYKEFLIEHYNINPDLKHGHVFNKSLLVYARMNGNCQEIIDYLKDFDTILEIRYRLSK